MNKFIIIMMFSMFSIEGTPVNKVRILKKILESHRNCLNIFAAVKRQKISTGFSYNEQTNTIKQKIEFLNALAERHGLMKEYEDIITKCVSNKFMKFLEIRESFEQGEIVRAEYDQFQKDYAETIAKCLDNHIQELKLT